MNTTPIHFRHAVSALALLAACAAAPSAARAQGRAEALLSSRPAPREGCTVEPGRLPALSAFADSAALLADLRAAASRASVQGDSAYAIFSVRFGDRGGVERVVPVDWFLPEGAAEPLAALVRRSLRAPGGETRNLRVRVDFRGGEPMVRVGHSEICLPRGLERLRVRATAMEHGVTPRPARVRVAIGPAGELANYQLVTPSGIQYLDDAIQRMVGERRYTPGLVDGIPTLMEYEQTVTFQTR